MWNRILLYMKKTRYEKLYIKSFYFLKYAVRYRYKVRYSQELMLMYSGVVLYCILSC